MSHVSPGPEVIDPITGQPAALRYEDVHIAFGDFQVLKGLDLIVPQGRLTFLVGPSGSGKSVTFKLALGLLEPDEGRVWVGDYEVTALPERQRKEARSSFGVVFQHAALFDSMSVFENVAFPLREHTKMSRSEISDRVMGLLEQVNLTGSENKMPSELSGGMQKRVGLARALAREPRYLFYDEPTTGLDPVISAAMHELILTTQRQRPELTSFIISHDLEGAMAIADKVAMLFDGQIAHATDTETFQHLDDPRVQEFLHPSMKMRGTP